MRREFIHPTERLDLVTKCSSYDSRLRFITSGIAFCYPERLDASRLRAALARVLSDFSVFSGRLSVRHGTLQIEHDAGGVPLEIVERSELSRELGAQASASPKHKKLLLPDISLLRSQRNVPMLAARLTHTADGSVLGVTWHHTAGDMHSVMLLMRAWALAYRGCSYDKPLQVLDPATYLSERVPTSNGARALHLASWTDWLRICKSYAALEVRPVTLQFTWQELSALRARAERSTFVTELDSLSAHVFASVRKLYGTDARALSCLTINYRKRLHLPSHVLGNFVDVVRTTVGPHHDTADVAAALRANIEAFPSSPLYQQELVRLEASYPARTQRMRFVYADMDPRRVGLTMTVTSWARFGIYELAFEESKPTYVQCRPFDQGNWFAIVFESPDHAGLSVRAWLPSRLAGRLERDHADSVARA